MVMLELNNFDQVAMIDWQLTGTKNKLHRNIGRLLQGCVGYSDGLIITGSWVNLIMYWTLLPQLSWYNYEYVNAYKAIID